MYQLIETQVLVIGGGSAGLSAAVKAKEQGVDVTLLFKKGGNNTVLAAGGHSAVLNIPGNDDTLQKHYTDTIASGQGLSSANLVKIFVEKAPQAIEEIMKWGVLFYRDDRGDLRLFRSGGHSESRSIRCEGGNTYQLYRVMYNKVKSYGIKIISNITVNVLLKYDNQVCGAIGINDKGELVVIKALAVILATGGLGQMYLNTTNSAGITGEGYILGLEAGAVLRDMEFIQFIPTSFVYPECLKGQIVNDTLRGEGAVLLNRNHERFMSKYSPKKMEMDTRDIVARSIYQEIIEERGTLNHAVYLDARHVDKKSLMESLSSAKRLLNIGIDPSKMLIEVAPSSHFCCGGIEVDENCYTGVPGLWSVGEVTGGIHGANRLGANALTENLVFGNIAGVNSGIWAKGFKKTCPHIPSYIIKEYINRSSLINMTSQKSDEIDSIHEELDIIESKIKQVLWQSAGIIRKQETLESGIESLSQIEQHLQQIKRSKGIGTILPLCQRLSKACLLGKIILKMAELRKESRGTHYRSDYPLERTGNPESIKVEYISGKLNYSTK